jgi:membrane protein CcdC involved in cytochrome C biogenesis
MAGGWGVATLALGVIRIWSSTKPIHFDAMKLMGLFEGSSLIVFTLIYLAVGRATIVQALLPLTIGVVFGVLYFISIVRRAKA